MARSIIARTSAPESQWGSFRDRCRFYSGSWCIAATAPTLHRLQTACGFRREQVADVFLADCLPFVL